MQHAGQAHIQEFVNKYSVQCVLLTRGMYGSGKNVDRSHSKQLEAQSFKCSFIYLLFII